MMTDGGNGKNWYKAEQLRNLRLHNFICTFIYNMIEGGGNYVPGTDDKENIKTICQIYGSTPGCRIIRPEDFYSHVDELVSNMSLPCSMVKKFREFEFRNSDGVVRGEIDVFAVDKDDNMHIAEVKLNGNGDRQRVMKQIGKQILSCEGYGSPLHVHTFSGIHGYDHVSLNDYKEELENLRNQKDDRRETIDIFERVIKSGLIAD